MQKMHDRKNIGKLILDPSAEPKPKPATPAKVKAKKEKKEKVTSPTTDEERKVEDGEPSEKPAENGAAEDDVADAEKPKENGGDGDAKPADTKVETAVPAAETNGEGKQKKSFTLRLTRMLSK